MPYAPADNRYQSMKYNRTGRSGLKLPAISLGLWHNFGEDTPHQTKRAICRRAFDLGITHFDLIAQEGQSGWRIKVAQNTDIVPGALVPAGSKT